MTLNSATRDVHPTPSLTRFVDDGTSSIVTPLHRSTYAHKTASPSALLDVAAQLQAATAAYDENLNSITETMGALTDSNEALFARRLAVSHAALDEVDKSIRATKAAKEQSLDSTQLSKIIEQLDSLGDEKYRLLLRIEEDNKNITVLNGNKTTCEQTLSELNEKYAELMHDSQNKRLPTLNFIRKLLKSVSGATLRNEDGDKISGIICNSKSVDAVPFECPAYQPSFQEVNGIWEVILRKSPDIP